jgi:MFS family permease
MGLADNLSLFYLLAAVTGILADVGQPAQQAIVADILPEKRQAEGFGIWRVVINIAITIGPLIGALLATRSYLTLFIADAVSSYITAAVVFFILPETRPAPTEGQPEESISQSLAGYLRVLRDRPYVAFIIMGAISVLVYAQMYSTLPVFLRDFRGIPDQGYAILLSMNAAMVVLFQFWITRRLAPFPPMPIIVAGCVFYAVGFGMFGFNGSLLYFALAMAVLTVGEMFIAPTGQAVVARLAPAAMRGRYMAAFGLAWGLPFGLAPLLAGLVIENAPDPNWLWYGSFVLALIAAAGFFVLHLRLADRLGQLGDSTPDPAPEPTPAT